jgi:hypothetical protein
MMSEPMTSHLYHISDGPVAYDATSHSETRRGLKIGDTDQSYAEVEWLANDDKPQIRLPDSWRNQQREDCRNWYAKHMPTRKDMMRWCVTRAAIVKIVPGEESAMDGIESLLKVTTLNCSGCTGLKSLPALPKVTWLGCSCCTGLKSMPALPKATVIDCYGCTGLKDVNVPPSCAVYR